MVNSPEVLGIYRHACPNCGGEIDDYRLSAKAPCSKCLPSSAFKKALREIKEGNALERAAILKIYSKYLRREGRFAKLIEEERKLEEFTEFFEKATRGLRPWSAQKTWAKRALKGNSFSIVAPTGVGKTSFSLILALYMYKYRNNGEWGKIYLTFPTTPILLQAYEKIKSYAENSGINVCSEEGWGQHCLRILCIHGKLRENHRSIAISRLEEGDFDILMSTSAFFHKHVERISGKIRFGLIVMDDVDSVLRSKKAVLRTLRLLGINEEHVEKGLRAAKLKASLARASGEHRDEVLRELGELEKELKPVKERIRTVLIVNSATGRPRGIYPKLFKVFLNFEIGSRREALRNIVDIYVSAPSDELEELARLIEKLGDGGLVYVPVDGGIEYAEEVARYLMERGIKAEAFHSKREKNVLDRFRKGEIQVLVGVAIYYGVMVRGIDLPERIKYAIFLGIPRHKFSSKLEELSPLDIVRLAEIVSDVIEDEAGKRSMKELIARINVRLMRMSPGALAMLREDWSKMLKEGNIEGPELLGLLKKAYDILSEYTKKPEIWERLKTRGDVGIKTEKGVYYIYIPDVATYIQASGRTSRLYPGGLSKGLSIVVVDDQRLLNGLIRRMRWLYEGFEMRGIDEIDLDAIKREIDEERKKIREILEGKVPLAEVKDLVKSALLIVESPNKAKTIAKFFGKPSVRVIGELIQAYEVTVGDYILTIVASGGHVYDLIVDNVQGSIYGVLEQGRNGRFVPIYTDIKKCDKGHTFTNEDKCPKCQRSIVGRKLEAVEALRELASEADVVLIGTDPDTEGEKIAWDIYVLLAPYANLIKRVEFHEVTKKAILEALRNQRDINTHLVKAQIVRRIEDRWLGFSLSKMVQTYAWRHICPEERTRLEGKIGRKKEIAEVLPNCCEPNRNLSAGRVQTPVLDYIIGEDRRRSSPENLRYVLGMELDEGACRGAFKEGGAEIYVPGRLRISPERLKKLRGEARSEGSCKLYVELKCDELRALGFECKELGGREMSRQELVIRLSREEERISPPPPYTTDMLLEDASRLLYLPSDRVMELAQDLFEMGLITYHRTDSTRISDMGLLIAKQYLEERYGAEKARELFTGRTWGAGGAHEAIRPTRPLDEDRLEEIVREGLLLLPKTLTRDRLRLYGLIFNRFIASQMPPCRISKLVLEISGNGGTVRKEDIIDVGAGCYNELYHNIEVNEALRAISDIPELRGVAEMIISIALPKIRHHDVIRWMKENGIGRPSTYARIVQTLVDRKYVIVSSELKALIPTKRGKEILEFLMDNFSEVVNVDTTRKLERKMDLVESGQEDYQEVLRELLRELKDKVEALEPELNRKYPLHSECTEVSDATSNEASPLTFKNT